MIVGLIWGLTVVALTKTIWILMMALTQNVEGQTWIMIAETKEGVVVVKTRFLLLLVAMTVVVVAYGMLEKSKDSAEEMI